MRGSRFTPRSGLLCAITIALAGLATGCSEDHPKVELTQSEPVDELAQHEGEPCPVRMPISSLDAHGFGARDPAEARPDFPAVDRGWVCLYAPKEAGPADSGNGIKIAFHRDGAPVPVPRGDLADLESAISQLEPVEDERSCTADLGGRWMLVVSTAEGDLTGIVIDDYGCKEVRLTTEPFVLAPGDEGPGTVAGVLQAPEGLLSHISGS